MTFSLEMARAAVVDVTVDDDLNIFTLALLSGRPHVMSCSLLTKGKVSKTSKRFKPSLKMTNSTATYGFSKGLVFGIALRRCAIEFFLAFLQPRTR